MLSGAQAKRSMAQELIGLTPINRKLKGCQPQKSGVAGLIELREENISLKLIPTILTVVPLLAIVSAFAIGLGMRLFRRHAGDMVDEL